MRRTIVMLVIGCLTALSAGEVYPAPRAAGKTTLDRTIVAEGERDLAYGPGQRRVTRTLGWKQTKGRGRPLVGFKQLSDVHVVDEESPARVEFLDQCSSPFSSAYRPQEAMSTQIGNSMLRALARIDRGPATDVPLKFAVSTGDNIDNNQLNDQRWFVQLLDGEVVDPNSGSEEYEGYTKEQFSQALDLEVLEAANEPFDAVGTSIPWYAVLGNHDGLVQGNAPNNDSFEAIAVGGTKPFANIEGYQDCPEGESDDPDPLLGALQGALGTQPRPVSADEDRHFLSRAELVQEFFNSSGSPRGHGMERSPADPAVEGARLGYYTFPMAKKVVGISLDTIAYDPGASNGHIPDPQFRWLKQQLRRFSKRNYGLGGKVRRRPKASNKLIMVFSHHSSPTLNNPGGDPEMAPYHCFEESDQPECEGGEGLHSLLDRFPNVIAWVNGHEHNNRVAGFGPAEGEDPARAFWEINTAAHIDWPQQSRLIEVAWRPGRKADTVIIYGTIVDHAAAPDPAAGSQRPEDYLASIGRVEGYYDACVRQGQASCEAPGTARDRNVKLVQKAPFDLGGR